MYSPSDGGCILQRVLARTAPQRPWERAVGTPQELEGLRVTDAHANHMRELHSAAVEHDAARERLLFDGFVDLLLVGNAFSSSCVIMWTTITPPNPSDAEQ